MPSTQEKVDVVLIGGGIMSATLGAMLTELQPEWDIRVYEKLDYVAKESSDPWNNAGTGHAALCELNYTPRGCERPHRPEEGLADQRAVPPLAPVLVAPRRHRRPSGAEELHQPGPAHQLRPRREGSGLHQEPS